MWTYHIVHDESKTILYTAIYKLNLLAFKTFKKTKIYNDIQNLAHFYHQEAKRNTKRSKYRFRHVVCECQSLSIAYSSCFTANIFILFKYIYIYICVYKILVGPIDIVQDTNLFRHWAVFRFIDNFIFYSIFYVCKSGKFDIFSFVHTLNPGKTIGISEAKLLFLTIDWNDNS